MPKLKKLTNLSQNGLENPLLRKGTPVSLPKPKKVHCFQCSKDFFIKYVVPNKSYSKKNNGEYGTNPTAKNPDFGKDKGAREQDQQICDVCLLKLYYNKEVYGETITDLKRRAKLTSYIFARTISV